MRADPLTRTVVESDQSSGTRLASDSLALIGIKVELIDVAIDMRLAFEVMVGRYSEESLP